MVRDVAVGMVYLHSRRPPVIHGDLRSPNLLLEQVLERERERPRFSVKIADFGLARALGSGAPAVAVSKARHTAVLCSAALGRVCIDVCVHVGVAHVQTHINTHINTCADTY